MRNRAVDIKSLPSLDHTLDVAGTSRSQDVVTWADWRAVHNDSRLSLSHALDVDPHSSIDFGSWTVFALNNPLPSSLSLIARSSFSWGADDLATWLWGADSLAGWFWGADGFAAWYWCARVVDFDACGWCSLGFGADDLAAWNWCWSGEGAGGEEEGCEGVLDEGCHFDGWIGGWLKKEFVWCFGEREKGMVFRWDGVLIS